MDLLPKSVRIRVHHPIRPNPLRTDRIARWRTILLITSRNSRLPVRRALAAAPEVRAAVRGRPLPFARLDDRPAAVRLVVGAHGASLGQAVAADVGAPGRSAGAAGRGGDAHTADVGLVGGAGAVLEEVEV